MSEAHPPTECGYPIRIDDFPDDPQTAAIECFLLACDLLRAEIGPSRARKLLYQAWDAV